MAYLVWLVILGVVAWLVNTKVTMMDGNVKTIFNVGVVVVALVLLWGLLQSVVGVPALPTLR